MSKLPTSRLPVTPGKTTNAPKSGLRPPQQTSSNPTNTSQQVSPSAGDSSNASFSIGDRVTTNGKSGTVAFIGTTKFADGEWMGIILDESQGKNDGSYDGIRYFETEPNRGLFCRSAKVQRLVQNGASNSAADTSITVKPQTTPLPDASKASASTLNVDKDAADTTLVNPPATDANTTVNEPSAASTEPSSSPEFHVGDRVVVSGTKFGTLKYLGKIHVAEGIWCGIQLDEPLGKNDGSVSGKRYFTCQQRYGLFSPLARVEKVTNEMTQSQIIARKASVSSSINNNRPLHRSNSQESLQSNLSEFSTSSNSISRIPTRPPTKMQQQQKLANNANIYTTPNTKSLLTQAAATLAAVTPSSNQIPQLVQTLREKDIYIEKLQAQSEQDRLEFSRAAQQADEMESRMLAIKQQYDIKEVENEQLKKEQYQAQQRIEDLEFQLEEYKLTDAHKEHSSPSAIPDGHRLLSPKDIEIYEGIKQKVLELETANQKLILEKQTLQDEHRQELKRQSELNENEYKSRLNDLEQKYTNNQSSATDTIKLEYEKKLIDKDEQTTKLLQEKQQELDQFKAQLTDLQTTQGKTLSEKETLYEEQQSKLEQSIKEIEKIRMQLTALQQEKDAKEKQANDLLSELKRHQENLLPELEKQCQTLKYELAEFQNRNQSASAATIELQSQYEQQIKEYQSNIKQSLEETEKVRTELKQFQEENLVKEKQTNDLINSLKQEKEKLQAELNHRELQANSTLNEREAQYEQQIKDYQSKLEQTTKTIQTIQSELTKLQEEKNVNEKTIETLKQDYEKLQNQLQQHDREKTTLLNERETQYETRMKDYETKADQFKQEIQDLRKVLEEKTSQEKQLNDSIHSFKKESEQQIQVLKTQITEFESQNKTTVTEFTAKDQQLHEYQSKLDQMNQTNNVLRQQIEEKQMQINLFQQEIANKQHTQLESTEQVANLQSITETLKGEIQEWQSKYSDLQSECQKQLISNEQLKNTTDNIANEKQAVIDQLTKEIHGMQQAQTELIDKQIKQHEDYEKQEKVFKEKIDTYEKQIQSMKNEFLLEIENNKLTHEQERLRLSKALQEINTSDTSSANTNVKQLEYELTEARYQIEKFKKQIEMNATQDDRATLESQINFLNSVIIDLKTKNEEANKEIQFLKNPFNAEEEFSQTTNTRIKSSAPRLYCDMCEVFDQHDTDDCPKQSSIVDDQPSIEHQTRERVIPPPRAYCEKCEEFGHDCNEADETY